MEMSKGNNKNKFLEKKLGTNISKKHQAYLGTEIPTDYFDKTKLSILNKVKSEKSENNFLKDDFSDITKHHKQYLGAEIPEDYFKESKQSILNKVKSESSNSKFLKEQNLNTLEKHSTYLGAEIPKDYFKKSKESILDKISLENKSKVITKKPKVFYLRPQFKYAVAASLVFILSLTIWLQNSDSNNLNNIDLDALAYSDDVLVESLLIDDDAIDSFTETTLFEEVVVKAEENEQKLDNLILNSLIVEDSLLDNYIQDEMIETIIL